MRRLSSLSFVAAVLVTAACSSAPTAPVDQTLVLAPGHTSSVGPVSITFFGVTLDTRCPADAVCIQMGDAFMAFEIDAPGARRALELQLLNPTNKAATVAGYTIAVESLDPYPFASQPPINPKAYRVQLRVTR